VREREREEERRKEEERESGDVDTALVVVCECGSRKSVVQQPQNEPVSEPQRRDEPGMHCGWWLKEARGAETHRA
jgi:hypothetical protein